MIKVKYIAIIIVAILSFSGCSSAFQNMKISADKGDAKSQNEVGLNYYYGTKDIKVNKKLGLIYFEKAAKQNNSEALFNIARINERNKNYTKAIEYYNRAIKNNYGLAYGNLGIMYHNGIGVNKNLDTAIKLYKLADKHGDYLAKRNLALLYKEKKEYAKSEKLYREILFAPPYKKNDNAFKQMILLTLMNMNNEKKNYEKAYVWGGTAVLSGLFDGRVTNEEKHLDTFTNISNNLSNKKKVALSKRILLNHYNIFQINEYYFRKYPELKSDDAVSMAGSRQLMHLIGFQIAGNKEIIRTINYFKEKSDLNAKINVSIGNLKLASSYIELGAIIPNIGMAIDKINEAKKILDNLKNKNLVHLKNNINAKLLILKDIKSYQSKIHEVKRQMSIQNKKKGKS